MGSSRLPRAWRVQGDATRSDSDEDKTSTHFEEDLDKFRVLRATGVWGHPVLARGSWGSPVPGAWQLRGPLHPEMKMSSLVVTPNGHLEGRGSLPPPLIMHTAATPMPTPKSSPHLDMAHGLLDSRRGSSSSVDPQQGDQKSLVRAFPALALAAPPALR